MGKKKNKSNRKEVPKLESRVGQKKKETVALPVEGQGKAVDQKEAEKHFAAGIDANEKGDYRGAVECFAKAIEINPRDATAYYNRGNVKFFLGKHAEALADYDKAIEINSEYADAYGNRGNAKHSLGKHAEALADYDKTIETNPKNATAYYNRGNVKFFLGKHAEALADYDKAIEINSEYADAYGNRGNAKHSLGKHAEALADYDKAIEINPKNATAYHNRGNAYYNRGNAYYNRGNVKFFLGKHAEALADYDKAIEINPKHSTAYGNRGNAKHLLGKHVEMLADYDKAIEINPRHFTAYGNRGNAKNLLGNHAEALADYDKAIEINRLYAGKNFFTFIAFTTQSISNETRVDILKNISPLILSVYQIKGYLSDKEGKEKNVFHYTNLTTLKALGEGGRFRLYNASYMNDPEEGHVFLDMIGMNSEWRQMLYLKTENSPTAAYIGSFVMETDEMTNAESEGRLSLWRAYGRHDEQEAGGCRLRFPIGIFSSDLGSGILLAMQNIMAGEQFEKSTEGENKPIKGEEFHLQKICYVNDGKVLPRGMSKEKAQEMEENIQKMKQVLDAIYEEFSNTKIQGEVLHIISVILDDIRFLFKGAYHAYEQEARVVVFRPLHLNISEYVQMDMSESEEMPDKLYVESPKKFRCNEITLGSKVERHGEWAYWLQEKQEITTPAGEKVLVKKSKIPVR